MTPNRLLFLTLAGAMAMTYTLATAQTGTATPTGSDNAGPSSINPATPGMTMGGVPNTNSNINNPSMPGTFDSASGMNGNTTGMLGGSGTGDIGTGIGNASNMATGNVSGITGGATGPGISGIGSTGGSATGGMAGTGMR